ncbi:MAG: hypothetical protein AAF512_09150 [Pseudomonadota bacterium]
MEAKTIKPGVFYECEGFSITAILVDHHPIAPAFGYRIDYTGRSVVISDDTVVVESLMQASKEVNLLLHDALSPAILNRAIQGAKQAGLTTRAKILSDVKSYHTHTTDIVKALRLRLSRNWRFII